MTDRPLIALIHGTPAAVAPAAAGLEEGLPDATRWNILDDRLLVEAGVRGGVDQQLEARMQRLIAHAIAEGAEAVLLTCSMYGGAAVHAAREAAVPVLTADESVFARAIGEGFGTVLVVATLEASRADTAARLGAIAAGAETAPAIDSTVPEGSFEATGDPKRLLESVSRGLAAHPRPYDAVLLAQYSLAPIARQLEARLEVPVLSGPQAAATDLRERLADACHKL